MNTLNQASAVTPDSSSISDAKLAANRANAALSTGPKTEEGKAASSRNNFRHGFTGAFTVLSNENADHFSTICAQLIEDHRPQTTTELMLVNDIARHYWLTQRALNLQEWCIEKSFTDPAAAKQLGLYLRYQTTHQRAYHKCLQELRTMRREADRRADREVKREAKREAKPETKPEAVGFESQKAATASKQATKPEPTLPENGRPQQTEGEVILPETLRHTAPAHSTYSESRL